MSGAELDMSNGRVALASCDWEVIGWVDLDQLTDDEVADGEFGHALIGSVDVPSPADAAWIIGQYGGGEFDGEVGGSSPQRSTSSKTSGAGYEPLAT